MTKGLRLFITCAVLAALAVLGHAGIKGGVMWLEHKNESYTCCAIFPIIYSYQDHAVGCYPWPWQQAQRQHLFTLSRFSDSNVEAALAEYPALYTVYAKQQSTSNPKLADIMREAIRRDPNNALYHYKLASSMLNRAVKSRRGYKIGKQKTPKEMFVILDRPLLDAAMAEVLIGMKKPYHGYREDLVAQYVKAMPPTEEIDDYIRLQSVLAWHYFYGDISWHASFIQRMNGLYVQTLLDEGNVDAARRYLMTGSRLTEQIVRDTSCNVYMIRHAELIVHDESQREASLWRAHGLIDEANQLEQRHAAIMGGVHAYNESRRKARNADTEFMRLHCSILDFGTFNIDRGNNTWITVDSLKTARLLEYAVVDEIIVVALLLLLTVNLAFLGIRGWLLRQKAVGVASIALTRRIWRWAIGLGILMPLTLYGGMTIFPKLAGREFNLVTHFILFLVTAGVTILWVVFVPRLVLWQHLRRQCRAVEESTRKATYRLSMLRALTVTSALSLLLLSAMYFALLQRERTLVHQYWQPIINPATGVPTAISPTEARLASELRATMRDGAKRVRVPWE